MVSEEISQQFDLIEEKVEKLIKVCKSLEKTNVDLKNRIKDLEQELQDRDKAEKQHIEQRDLVREKIDRLMKKLENFSETES